MLRVFRQWGATRAEVERPLAADACVPHPTYATTLAVTVNAPPADLWPWLVQIGYQRGGLYSYDWLDRLFGYLDRPSANVILPEHQRLAVGDVIPIGRGPGFPVTALVPLRSLVLSGTADGVTWAWQFELVPIDARHTRLLSRNLVSMPRTIGSWIFLRLIEPAAFLMTRRMLLGLKRRAEAGTEVVFHDYPQTHSRSH